MGKGAGKFLGDSLGSAIPGLGMATSLFDIIKNSKEQRDAKDALENYKRQELTNVTDGMTVSTLGANLQREESARNTATAIDALQQGGQRVLIGGVGRTVANADRLNSEIGAGLDMQQKQIDQMRAEDNASIRNLQEGREIADINALSSQYQSGKQGMAQGIGNFLQSGAMLGQSLKQQSSTDESGISGANTQYSEIPRTIPYPTLNSTGSGVMTKTGGSGIGAVDGFENANYNADFMGRPINPAYGIGYSYNRYLNRGI